MQKTMRRKACYRVQIVFLFVWLSIIVSPSSHAFFKPKKQVPASVPPSAQVVLRFAEAKKILVVSSGEESTYYAMSRPPGLAYSFLYQAIQKWGFQLADSPRDADLVLDISGTAQSGSGIVGSAAGDSQLRLKVIDPNSSSILWDAQVPLYCNSCYHIHGEKAMFEGYNKALASLLLPLAPGRQVTGFLNVPSPAPQEIRSAKKVFIATGQAIVRNAYGDFPPDLVEACRNALNNSVIAANRFAVSNVEADADITLELIYETQWYTVAVGEQFPGDNLRLTARDSKTQIELWAVRIPIPSTRQKNEVGFHAANATRLLQELLKPLSQPSIPSIPVPR
ncbi:MAG: hypothetical protein PW792_17260 [Acidobacteriaceae bacterium]|nr:hypothetical protein [Acidobacteriaceae bacterium]